MKSITKNFKSLVIMIIMVLGVSQSLFASTIQTDTLKVSGNCGMCEKRIVGAVSVKGVKSAQWNMESQILTIKYDADKVTLDELEQKISKAGHDTPNYQADEKVYQSLHHCCQYTR